jgi:hypothetical protein
VNQGIEVENYFLPAIIWEMKNNYQRSLKNIHPKRVNIRRHYSLENQNVLLAQYPVR